MLAMHAGQHERHVEMPADVVAEAAHARLARLDAAQREAERRGHQQRGRRAPHSTTTIEHDVVVLRGVGDAEAADRRERHVGHAVVAAGERRPAVGDAPDDVAERQRDQDEVDAARAHREREDEREQRAGEDPGGRRERGADAVAHLQDRGGVGGDREERRMAEREQAGMAEQQIGRKREQPEDHDLGQQRRSRTRRRTAACAAASGETGDDERQGASSQCSLPKIPVARNSSSTAIGPNSTK